MTGKGEGEPGSAIPAEMVLALGHSQRRGILRFMLAQEDGTATSPAVVASALGEPLPNVAYHFRVLKRKRLLIPTKKQKVRGATQHFYRLSDAVTASDWAVDTLRAAEVAS